MSWPRFSAGRAENHLLNSPPRVILILMYKHTPVGESLFKSNFLSYSELSILLSLMTSRSSEDLNRRVGAWWGTISWTCGWMWKRLLGEKRCQSLGLGACGCGSTVTTTAITQACAALVTKQHFNDTAFFFFLVWNGKQLLIKSPPPQNKILSQFIWYLHSYKIHYKLKEWSSLCFNM